MKKEQLHEKIDFENMRHLVEWAAETYGEKYAYSYRLKASDKDAQKVSFLTLRDDVRALTSKLIKMGVKGKQCVLIGKFSYEWVITYFSVLSADGVLAPMDSD